MTLRRQANLPRGVRSDERLVAIVPKEFVAIEEEAQINEHRDAIVSAAQMKSPWFDDL